MLVSIIIPVYNVEKYLETCLNSIKLQTYTNFEVILVNDGSNDKSKEICLKFVADDHRFKLFNQENNGVSAARNLGLHHAEGDWLTFIDSDDEVTENYLKDLINLVKTDEIDFVFQGVNRIKENQLISKTEIQNDIVNVTDKERLFNVHKVSLNGNPVSKLFKADIIKRNNLNFNEKFSYNEDKIFILEYILKCENNIVFSDVINYKYYIHKGSLTNKLLQPEKYFEPYKYFKNLLKNKFEIDYNKNSNSVFFENFKIYLHMYVNAVFVHKSKSEKQYLKYLDEEDWNIYYKISNEMSSKPRKIFDFFLARNLLFFPRIIAKFFIAPHFKL